MKLLLSFSACLSLLLWSCGLDSGVSERAEDIIYTVGSFRATRFEVDRAFENFRQSHAGANDRLLEAWMDDMLARGYFLADAYARRYDTLSAIQKKLVSALKHKIAQEGGYLWKRNVAPKLKVSDSEIADAYAKRSDLFYVELLFFSNDRLLQDLGKRFSSGSSPEFYDLVKEFRDRSGVEFVSVPLIYPFAQFASAKDEIYQMKAGDMLGPVSQAEGSYIIHLTHKQKRDVLSVDADRPSIEQDLISLKRKLAIDSKQDSIYRTSKIAFHDDNIERLAGRLKKKVVSIEMDTATLMTYHLNNTDYRFRAGDYKAFIKYSPMLIGDFAEPQQIRNNLKDHLIREYLYEEASRAGILDDKTFLLEKQQYYNALLEQHYYTEEFERKLEISEQELVDYYKNNQSLFPAEQIAWVSFIEFANEHAAYDAISYFQTVLAKGDVPKLSDTTEVQGLMDIKGPELINGANTAWGEDNRKQFIGGKENVVFGPITHNNRAYLYYVNKKGVENVKEFSTVRDRIYARLKPGRMGELKLKKINDLRTQFQEDATGLKAYCESRKGKR